MRREGFYHGHAHDDNHDDDDYNYDLQNYYSDVIVIVTIVIPAS